MKYTYDSNFQAHMGNGIVCVPDQVANDQRGWVEAGNKSFPAVRHNGKTVRVRIDSDATGLFTPGTGDLVVKSA